MVAGKGRKHTNRIYNDKRTKLTKCKVIFGANASGKSNFVEAFSFFQEMILNRLPRGFSEKYYRLNPENKNAPSEFEVELKIDSHVFCYGFSIILSTGSVIKEYLYEKTKSGKQKLLYERDTDLEMFFVGNYFRQAAAVAKLYNYGDDSSDDKGALFLSIINMNKGKMFADFPELIILKHVFNWFVRKLSISFPESILTGYPHFTDSNLEEIADIMNALGTGICELRIVEVPAEMIKNKVPDDLYNKILADLEKSNAQANDDDSDDSRPRIMLRSYKEFYTFEIDSDNKVTITTIEFSHENRNVYFDLNEESDGTARLLDLIEILFNISDNQVFIIDEIDRCLHPTLTVKIIEMFLKMAEIRDTQLIITSHESRLLASEILRNDEICFISKNGIGESDITPLEKYQLRTDKNVYAALFDGTVDATPVFDDIKLQKVLSK